MTVYRNEEGPYTKKDFEVIVDLPHPTIQNFITYKHCNLPIMGVGPNGDQNRFLYFDHLLDLAPLNAVRDEVLAGERNQHIRFNKIVANGIIPAYINGQKCIDSYIHHIEKYAPRDDWKAAINQLTRKGDIKIFFHEYFNIKLPWAGIAMFREYSGKYEEKSNPSNWLSLIEYFPRLQKFVEALPFKYVGYVMIFKSTGNGPVLTHRDYYPTNHTVNFINFRLNQRPRPFFLYDCSSNQKIYSNPEANSYFFNEIDAHGMDAESETQYTLRVEGQFRDDFKDQIGLGGYDTFNWDFEHCQNFLKTGHFKIEQSTDI